MSPPRGLNVEAPNSAEKKEEGVMGAGLHVVQLGKTSRPMVKQEFPLEARA